MLFLKLEQYGFNIHLFGDEPKKGSGVFRTPNHLNESYHCDYQAFSSLPRMYGKPFESVEIAGHKLVGYLNCPQWALSEEGGWGIAQLITWYVNHQVDVDFEKWLAINPMLREGRNSRSHVSVLRTYTGRLLLACIEHRKLKIEELTESCFIHNGFVTTLASAMEKRLQEAQRLFDQVKTEHAKIETKPWDLSQLLNHSQILNFVKSH